MVEKETDIISLLERALSAQPQEKLEEIGTVIKVGDDICKVYGLTKAVYGELIEFERGCQGIVLDLDEDYVSVVLLDTQVPVEEQEVARRTGTVFKVPAGEGLLGRIINAVGKPLDALGEIKYDVSLPIERLAPGIVQRTPVNQPLQTGIIVVDSLFPIGKGQRELIIGNRSTGKTSIALDTIINQKNKDVICIYIAIGHKQSGTAKFIYQLEKYDALDYTVVVSADAKDSALNQFLAPYSGCSIAEYFMNKGNDVLIIYDDLSKHAIAYRELSLLLRRPPGREAYPGDIFYIHSRLLERSCKLSDSLGGGSLTALPIAQTQGDDISAYIPTNLISITDGQIFLDTNLFNQGIRPAVNIGLSVSRVGGAAQTKAMKKIAGALKLELAQYNELQAFIQFGSELDKESQKTISRGKKAVELLKQDERKTYDYVDEIIMLFLLKANHLDNLNLDIVKEFAEQFASYVKETNSKLHNRIDESGDLTKDDEIELNELVSEFKIIFKK
ncbi:F0F1 ATP synthase subunit alpha [Candidatus Dependentiae bacterium]|nr:F0F1 ATP synthase subunit alpha [Candidatus Dependentiae bacterium]